MIGFTGNIVNVYEIVNTLFSLKLLFVSKSALIYLNFAFIFLMERFHKR